MALPLLGCATDPSRDPPDTVGTQGSPGMGTSSPPLNLLSGMGDCGRSEVTHPQSSNSAETQKKSKRGSWQDEGNSDVELLGGSVVEG